MAILADVDARARFVAWVAALEQRGVSRSAIAQRLGVSPSVITKITGNPARSVSLRLAVAIEREAGIPVAGWVDAA